MRVDDAFRLARRAGRVTHAERILFGEDRQRRVLVGFCEELLVVEASFGNGLARQRHDDDLLERGFLLEFVEQREEHVVDDEEAILRVVRDEPDLVGVKAQVERVEHAARDRDTEVSLEVDVVIPHERRHAITLA